MCPGSIERLFLQAVFYWAKWRRCLRFIAWDDKNTMTAPLMGNARASVILIKIPSHTTSSHDIPS
jgi:hypothetical protein